MKRFIRVGRSCFINLNTLSQYCFQCKFSVGSTGQSSTPIAASASGQSSGQSSSGRNPLQDYNDATKHVSSMIHEVMSGYRAVKSVWSVKKVKLHQRLALALFQDDVRQVIEWIDVHGEGFLKRNVTIGKNLSKARSLQKSHAHFDTVAQNTYTNSAKLLAAADEFAQTGECSPDDVYRIARELEARVRTFSDKVERRRQILHLTTNVLHS